MKHEVGKYVENIERAEDLLLEVFWDIRDKYGLGKEAKRLDTILAKVNDLKHELHSKQK